MTSFSPSEAAIEGFRLTWERPLATLAWTAVRFCASLIALTLFISQGGAESAQALAAAGDPASLTPEAASRLLAHAAPAILIFLAVNLVGYVLIYTAVLRAVLSPQARRFGGLRLSRDEALQFGLAVVVLALVFSYTVLATLVLSFLALLPGPLGGILRPLVFAAAAAGFIGILVRLSLAPAATFSAGRIKLFDTVPLTRGVFWSLLSTYLLAILLTLVVILLCVVIFFLIIGAIGLAEGGVAGLPGALKFAQANPTTVPELYEPRALITLLFDSGLATLAYVLLLAPGAAVFRALSNLRPAEPVARAAPKTPWS